jgi:hypothetical protein
MSTLVDYSFLHFKYVECLCIGGMCEKNDAEKLLLHFALTGVLIINDVAGWLCCSLLGWYDLLLTRCLHVSPLTMALHVVKVYM